MSSFRIAACGASLAFCVIGATTGFAQTTKRPLSADDQSALQDSCAGDYLRLCGQYSPDGPEVEQCFKARAKELSPDCSSAIASYSRKKGRR